MSKEKLVESSGMYNQLPPQIVERAYLLDKEYDLKLEVMRLEGESERLRYELGQDFKETALSLADSKEIDHDEFLRRYHENLLKLDQGSAAVREFDDMMAIRAELKPGVFVMNTDYTIEQIAESSDIGGINPTVRPVLYFNEYADVGQTGGFCWEVAVRASEVPVVVNKYTSIGKERITEVLKRDLRSGDDFWKNTTFINSFEKIGKTEEAQSLREHVAEYAERFLVDTLNHRVLSDKWEIITNLEVLAETDKARYQSFLNQVRLEAARGVNDKVVAAVVEHIARLEVKDDHFPPTNIEIAQANLEFVREGVALLARDKLSVMTTTDESIR